MKIDKYFGITLAHKFPNGDIASIKLGTNTEVDTVLDTASEKDIIKFNTKLAKQTYKATMRDIQALIQKDELAKVVYEGLMDSLQNEKDEKEAEGLLDRIDDDE